MTHEQEQEVKAIAERMEKAASGMNAFATGELGMHPQRLGMREELRAQIARAQSEASKLRGLRELDGLLEKHPEVARILELLEQFR